MLGDLVRFFFACIVGIFSLLERLLAYLPCMNYGKVWHGLRFGDRQTFVINMSNNRGRKITERNWKVASIMCIYMIKYVTFNQILNSCSIYPYDFITICKKSFSNKSIKLSCKIYIKWSVLNAYLRRKNI